ncbi:MAG: tRNA dihydrouridine synthase DusB [Puniceicoccaceae bacterium]|nr:MAG: tRNA dihydrouridine synthase DusB [Puniceicoccaceae bacterium]
MSLPSPDLPVSPPWPAPLAACGSRFFLSPLAGYTNLPFRLVLRSLGGLGLATTDLVNARSLLAGTPVALKLIATAPGDEPLLVQIFGSEPEIMADAARMLEERGVAGIDINMGCPVRRIVAEGSGSAMMNDLRRTAALVRRVVDAVRIPVTCKMRLGWDEENLTAPDLARALRDAGAAAFFVHGRTRAQGFSGRVNLAGIRRVVEAVPDTPVVGNGDVTTARAALRMLEETGCSAVSIGRGAFYNPWIFGQIRHYLRTGELPPEPGFEQRMELLCRHFEACVEFFGEATGCKLFRKPAHSYARRFGPASFFKQGINQVRDRDGFYRLLKEYRAWRRRFEEADGRLLPRYAPTPIASSLEAEQPEVADQIRVPQGPVEVW